MPKACSLRSLAINPCLQNCFSILTYVPLPPILFLGSSELRSRTSFFIRPGWGCRSHLTSLGPQFSSASQRTNTEKVLQDEIHLSLYFGALLDERTLIPHHPCIITSHSRYPMPLWPVQYYSKLNYSYQLLTNRNSQMN